MSSFEYQKICRLCLCSTNTYIVNIFHQEYNIAQKIHDLISIEVSPVDPFPKVICTDCFGNLVIFQEFKNICKNSESLLKKYQINKVENMETDVNSGMKGNGKCKSIRNSEEMAERMKDCALKKSMTFVENMKNFYFLLNLEESSAVIIKEENLIPTVEIKEENLIYPQEENHQVLISSGENVGTLHLNVVQVDNSSEHKRKKRKNNKRKALNINGESVEIDDSVNTEVVAASSGHHVATTNTIVVTTGGASGETIIVSQQKPSQENTIQTIQPTNTITTYPPATQTQTISIIPQIQYSCTNNECTDTFSTTDSLRQHLWHNHQILLPFPPSNPTIDTQYTHHIQTVPVHITQTQTATAIPVSTGVAIQPVTQQYTFHPHKTYFENSEIPCLLCGIVLKNKEDLIKHMIKHTSTSTIVTATPTNLTTTTNPQQIQQQTQIQHHQTTQIHEQQQSHGKKDTGDQQN